MRLLKMASACFTARYFTVASLVFVSRFGSS